MKKQNLIEKEKYLNLYKDKRKYGRRNLARKRNMYEIIKSMKINSICDVGCGEGQFCDWMTKRCSIVYGLDIASVEANKVVKNDKINYINAEARNIPLLDNSVEYVTCFDCLEHCLPKDINKILQEFYRIATKGFILSISYKQALRKGIKGENLHMTVRSEKWWIKQIKKICPSIKISKVGRKKSCLLCIF